MKGVGVVGVIRTLRPAKIEETVSHRHINKVKEVGTPPVPSNLCTPLTAVSTTVRIKVTKEQLCSKTNHPPIRAQLHLPAFDIFRCKVAVFVSVSLYVHGNHQAY